MAEYNKFQWRGKEGDFYELLRFSRLFNCNVAFLFIARTCPYTVVYYPSPNAKLIRKELDCKDTSKYKKNITPTRLT